ncbi:MAG: hypothetical protein HY319_16195 [Armatimonadetes bacterium]|nr:hypothetical protein [Armatimonadota bacterium]
MSMLLLLSLGGGVWAEPTLDNDDGIVQQSPESFGEARNGAAVLVSDELILSGSVEQVLMAPHYQVHLRTDDGVLVTVPLDTLLPVSGRDFGFDDIEEGDRVVARIPPGPGKLSVTGLGRLALTVRDEYLVLMPLDEVPDNVGEIAVAVIEENGAARTVTLQEAIDREDLELVER